MEALHLYYPVKPANINQGFGNEPAYYSKFHDFFGQPLKGHDGIDFHASHGTPVYAAHDGLIHYEKDAHGGEGMTIRTIEEFDYKGQPAYFRTLYWHLIGDTDAKYPSPLRLDGAEYPVKAGDLIGYADNTGAPYESSGDHLHFGLFPSMGENAATFAAFDAKQTMCAAHNGFNGRIDAAPFFAMVLKPDGTRAPIHAADVPLLISLYQQVADLLKMELSELWGRQYKSVDKIQ